MADTNPIKYSDLISPDDSITKLIAQLNELREVYVSSIKDIREQAAQLAETMKGVSGATADGRKKLTEAASATDELDRAMQNLEKSQSENAKKIAELKRAQTEQNTINKLTARLNASQEGSYDRLSAQYSLNKIRLNAMTQEQRKAAEASEGLVTKTREIYEQMKQLQEETGKYQLNVGNYQSAIQNTLGMQSQWFQQLSMLKDVLAGGVGNALKLATDAVKGFGKQLLALMMNPIVATIGAIAAAFMLLKEGISSSEENSRALQVILAPLKRIMEAVLNVIQEMTGWILRAVEGAEGLAMGMSTLAERLPVVGRYFQQMNNALQENINLEKERQKLEDESRSAMVLNAKTARDVAILRSAAAKTDDPKQRAKFLKTAIELEKRDMEVQRDLAVRRYENAKAQAAHAQNDKETNEELARLEAEKYRAEEQYYTGTLRLRRQLKSAEDQQVNDTKKNNKERVKSAHDTQKALEESAKKELQVERALQDAIIVNMTNIWMKREAQTKAQYDRQIEDLRNRLATEKNLTEEARKAINLTIKQIEITQSNELLKIAQERAIKELEVQQQTINLRLQSVKAGSDEEIAIRRQQIEVERQIAIKKNEMLAEGERQATDLINAQYDKRLNELSDVYVQSQLKLFDQQQNFAQSEFDLLEASEAKKTKFRLQAEADRLRKVLELNERSANKLSDIEVQTMQNTIKRIENEIVKTEKAARGKDIYSLIGLDISDEKKQAIDTSVSYAVDALNTFIDAYIQAANTKREAADRAVEESKRTLEAEIQAQREGYAANVDYASKELENARKTQQQAIKEQKKAQQAKLAMDAITQASNMVTASVLIWSQLGFPWAIPALAVMWGSFVASKVKAAQLSRQSTETYGEGTVELLEGGSHQSGNDIDLGTKPDGTRRRAEGGEYFAVINKRSSRKYRAMIPSIINSLNDGSFTSKFLRSYKDDGMAVNIMGNSPDLRELSSNVATIRQQGERKMYSDGNGTVIIYKNVKRRIR